MIEHSGRKLGNPRDGQDSASPHQGKVVLTIDCRSRPARVRRWRRAAPYRLLSASHALWQRPAKPLIGEGQLHTTTIGRRRLVMVHSLRTLLEAEDK